MAFKLCTCFLILVFLTVVFILFSSASGQVLTQPQRNESTLIWCTISKEEQYKCTNLMHATLRDKRRFGRDFFNLQCKQGFDKEECMSLLDEERADITSLDAGEVFIGGRYHSLVPFMQEVYPGGFKQYYAVAVVKRNSIPDVNTIADLRGKRACFAAVGMLAGWVIPIYTLMQKGGMSIVDCNNHVKSATVFFGPSCAVNSLIDRYNPIGDNSDRLCQLCIGKIPGGRCTRQDPYYGYEGAFRCLLEAGDVAFLKHTTVTEMITQGNEFSSVSKDNFDLLCVDGTRRPVDQYQSCNWGVVPTHAIVTSSAKSIEQRRKYQEFLTIAVDLYGKKNSSTYQQSKPSDRFGRSAQYDPYRTGTDPYQSGNNQYGSNSDQYRTGSNAYGTGNDQYRTGSNAYGTGNDQYRTGSNAYGNGNDPYRTGSNAYGTGNNPYSAGSNPYDPYQTGNNNSRTESNIYGTGNDPYRNNNDPYRTNNNNSRNIYGTGNDPYRTSTDNFQSGFNAYSTERDPYRTANDNYRTGNDNYRTGSNVYGTDNDRYRSNSNDRNNSRNRYTQYDERLNSNFEAPKYSANEFFGQDNNEPLNDSVVYEKFDMFESTPKYGRFHNLIFQDVTERFASIKEEDQTYKGFLGHTLDIILGVRYCPVNKMRLCVTSEPEFDKCVKMQMALKAQLLKPELTCDRGHSQINCMQAIRAGRSDVAVLDASDVYTAGLRYDLVPFISEVYNLETPEYYVVAVAREEDPSTELTYLRGKRTCHPGISTAAGWVYPLAYLISNGWIRSYGCNAVRAAAEYFSKSCVPGALSTEYNTGVPYDNMCDLCHGASYRYCRRDASEDYYGYTGAFRCLVEGGGDVAFLKHTTVAEITGGKRREFWARNTLTKDFQLLCPDGTRMEVNEYKKCNLGKVASNAIVSRGGYGYNETEINAYTNLFIYAQQFYGRKNPDEFSFSMFYSPPPYSDLIFQDAAQQLKIIEPERRYYSTYLGADFMRARRIVDCHAGALTSGPIVLLIVALTFVTSFVAPSLR